MPNHIKPNEIIEVNHAFLRATDYGLNLSDSIFTSGIAKDGARMVIFIKNLFFTGKWMINSPSITILKL